MDRLGNGAGRQGVVVDEDQGSQKTRIMAYLRRRAGGERPFAALNSTTSRDPVARAQEYGRRKGWTGASVSTISRELGINPHDVTHALYDLRKQGVIRFKESKSQSRNGLEKSGIGTPDNGVPVRIMVTAAGLLDPTEVAAVLAAADGILTADPAIVAVKSATLTRPDGEMVDVTGLVADMAPKEPVEQSGYRPDRLAQAIDVALVAHEMLREAEASVALDHDPEYGTQSVSEQGEASEPPQQPEASVVPVAEEEPAPEPIAPESPPAQEPVAVAYPRIRAVVGGQEHIEEAIRLLRLGDMNLMADMVEEERRLSDIEREVIEYDREVESIIAFAEFLLESVPADLKVMHRWLGRPIDGEARRMVEAREQLTNWITRWRFRRGEAI